MSLCFYYIVLGWSDVVVGCLKRIPFTIFYVVQCKETPLTLYPVSSLSKPASIECPMLLCHFLDQNAAPPKASVIRGASLSIHSSKSVCLM